MKDVPDEFDAYTVVILRRAADPPDLDEAALDALQAEHLAYRAELARQGVLVVNGPFLEQDDDSYRGMSIFACDSAEAARLSREDPSVRAGRGSFDVMAWWVRAGSLAFPRSGRPVEERRSVGDMP